MGNSPWTEKDSSGFAALAKNNIKEYKTIQALTEAHNALAEVKRSPGAIAFRLRSFFDSGVFNGGRKEYVDSMLYVFYSSLPKKEKPKKETNETVSPPLGSTTPGWMPADPFRSSAQCAQMFGYTQSWVVMLANRKIVRRSRENNTWIYSVKDIQNYLSNTKLVPPEKRAHSGSTSGAETKPLVQKVTLRYGPDTDPGALPWENDRDRLIKLYKAGKVDAATALDMLEKL